ncbi:MAG TPA: hypothetical protein VKA14_03045, partial [Gammaproteobacteria bacterium]|nr:hypothetical protein [Gammaproteobacteria bacterium]
GARPRSGPAGDTQFAALTWRPSAAYDQAVAWVPRNRAPTAAVARAMVHVALGRARVAAQSRLCADRWVFTGPTVETVGPRPGTAPRSMGHFPAWYYRITWHAEDQACPGVSVGHFYADLARHLPPWIRLQATRRLHMARGTGDDRP